MRLWHKDLIDVLPRQQLIAQWRECCAIAGKIAVEGTPNHLLVNKVLDYPVAHFVEYINRILTEMNKRSYHVSEPAYLRLVENLNLGKDYFVSGILINKNIYSGWMNERYLIQCFINLQEKYDCGGITKEEYTKILNKVANKTKEWEFEQ